MKFDFAIGNPPYQETSENTSDKPIYNLFMDSAFEVADKVELITPARFLFQAGKTPKDWNEKMLNDKHFKVLAYKQTSKDVFPGTDIKGGVAITYRDNRKFFGPIISFTHFEELNSILFKVKSLEGFSSIQNIIHQQNKLELDVLYQDHPNYINIIGSNGTERRLTTKIFEQLPCFFNQKENDKQIGVLGLIHNQRVYKYINMKYITVDEKLKSFKVLVPASNGTGALGEILSTPLIGEPLIGEPLIGFTQSFIGFGCFKDKQAAESLMKYIKTKFARTLLGILKITQHNHADTWKFVPLQDFTYNSDINWGASIKDIDRQLYKKYKLSADEIDFIETHVKEMD